MKTTKYLASIAGFAILAAFFKPEQDEAVVLHTGSDQTSITFLRDGLFAVGGENEVIQVRDCTSAEIRFSLTPEILQGDKPVRANAKVLSLAASDRSEHLVAGYSDNVIRVWNIPKREVLHYIRLEPSGPFERGNPVFGVCLSQDGKQFASGSADKIVRIWSTVSGKLISTLEGHTGFVYSVEFSPDMRRIASSASDMTIRIWDVETGRCKVLGGHTSYVRNVAISSDGKYLVSVAGDIYSENTAAEVKLWDFETGNHICDLPGHRGAAHSVKFLPRTTLFATSGGNALSKEGDIFLWDALNKKSVRRIAECPNLVSALSISSDCRLLACTQAGKTVRIFKLHQLPQN